MQITDFYPFRSTCYGTWRASSPIKHIHWWSPPTEPCKSEFTGSLISRASVPGCGDVLIICPPPTWKALIAACARRVDLLGHFHRYNLRKLILYRGGVPWHHSKLRRGRWRRQRRRWLPRVATGTTQHFFTDSIPIIMPARVAMLRRRFRCRSRGQDGFAALDDRRIPDLGAEFAHLLQLTWC